MLALAQVLAIGFDVDLSALASVTLYAVVWSIVFVESGLLIGFFLPGDTLLFAAGVATSTGQADVRVLIAGTVLAAILGDSTGYAIGRRAGRPMLEKRNGRVLNRHNLDRATAFYERWGNQTIVIARFVPVIRTIAPLVAGATVMPYGKFVTWNVIGGVLWGAGVPLAGFLVGEIIPGIEGYALALAGVMVLLSIVMAVVHYRRAGREATVGLIEEQAELIDD